MKLSTLIRQMSDAGAPPEAIAIAVEAIEDLQSHEDGRKARQAEKKRAYRNRIQSEVQDSPKTVRGQSEDNSGTEQGQSEDAARTVLTKERSPQTPLKEKPSLKEKPPKGGQKKRGSRLFEDWSLPNEYRDWALSQGFPASALEAEAARFRDYWISKPGKDGVKADWLATWRNWIRNADRFSMVRHPQAPPQPAPVDDYVQLLNFNQASRSAVISKLQLWLSGQIREWRYTPAWSDDHPPGHPDCVIPADLIEEAKRLAEADFPKQRAG